MYKKKSLGQHFLHNPYYLGLVADAADIKQGDTVVEIGPGEGTLTEKLLAFRCKVLAVEKDHRLIPLLQKKFLNEIRQGELQVVECDALLFELRDYSLEPRSYKLIGNIPYYISGALFKKFLESEYQPSTLVFLVQKEVAERIARSKKESILSLSVKAYGDVTYIKTVPRGAFSPPPKVDSAIIAVKNISRKNFANKKHEEKFFELIKKGFASKRKYLVSNLGKQHTNILKDVGVSEKARAEDVSLAQWLLISKEASLLRRAEL